MLEIKRVERGFKDNLVLIPGWATDYRIFQKLELDFNYLLVTNFTIFSFNQDLSEYLKDNQLEKVSLFGWSMGAFLAADFSVKNQERVERLVLAAARQRYDQEALDEVKKKLKENKTPWLYKFYLDFFSADDKRGLSWFRKHLMRDYLKEQELKDLLIGLHYLSQARLDLDSLKTIKDLTVLHGTDDLIVPIDCAIQIKNSLPGAKFSPVDKRGHIMWVKG